MKNENIVILTNKIFSGDYYGRPVAEIALNIFERMEEPTEEELQHAIDDELIYYNDLWAIIEFYQSPREANFEKAMDEFYEDLLYIMWNA